MSSKTVSAISKGEYNPKKAGPKPKFNQVHIDYVLEIAFLNPRMSSATMAQKFKEKFTQLTISATKVREIIKENGFRYLSCRKIQDLNSIQITLRYNFAFQYLDAFDADSEFWKILVFSDESRFCATSDAGAHCWRKTGDFRDDVCETHKKFPVSCMVWGAIGYNFKPDLIFIEDTLNSEGYINLLEQNQFLLNTGFCS